MKKYIKIMIIFMFLTVFTLAFQKIYAFENGFDENIFNQIDGGDVDQDIEDAIVRVYGTIATILKVVATAGVVYTGVKYMMAGAGDKGAIKQNLIYVVIGTVFVFAADAVIKFVIKGGLEII